MYTEISANLPQDFKEASSIEFTHGELPNRFTEAECHQCDPPKGPPDGEERLIDTGGTFGDFCKASKQIAFLLKKV